MILLIGGTSESLSVADLLTSRRLPFWLSVTTDYGQDLAEEHAEKVIETLFDDVTLTDFIQREQINIIIDASHPFAKVISTLALDVAKAQKIQYVRFERQSSLLTDKCVIRYETQEEVIDYLRAHEGNIYLSTGSKTAGDYADALGTQRLQVRILPTVAALEKVTNAGFEAHQIDAIRGPFSLALNVELLRRQNARYLITKDSGDRGGVEEKIKAAKQLDMTCLVINRPRVDYAHEVSSLSELERFITEVK
ncbi:precorrin-6A reductase [Furfurilactobacillus siliginis]|uniref:Precorrin-6A reductase n=1 Tax=Furfurilactobacillus siliginis TaxID=348151 RepID=A0A0R2L3J0_9LACO|nr:precorrin-6A reductase [Furfurilactobacillus siliginis]KRN96190.1 precorrin-6A reductase [Furfurilactobacillus siliginis]GEK27885.1 precorrin-6x reductase [Furfurilactobacillus siliginis]